MTLKILILYLLLVPVFSTDYKTNNAEISAVTEILLDIKTYLEHLPEVTALAERLSVLEAASKDDTAKLAAVETSLASKSKELVELRALIKRQEDQLLECSTQQQQSSSKIVELESKLNIEGTKLGLTQENQEKLITELDKRLRKSEDEELVQVTHLKTMEEKVVKGEEDIRKIESKISEFQDLQRDLGKSEIVTKAELQEVESTVQKLQTQHNQLETKESGLSHRLQALETRDVEKNVSLASLGGRLDTLKEFVHSFHTKEKKISLCPLPFVKVGADCLLMGSKKKKWTDARTYCKGEAQKIGGEGDLAVPSDRKAFVKYVQLLNTSDLYLWIGASDAETEGKWVWVTGENVDETDFPWDDGEPDSNAGQNYMCVTTKSGAHYHDCINDATLQFICQLY